jgi:hypothetical protein
MNKNTYFAEVIESSIDHFTAQCWQWNQYPTFGSLVVVQEQEKTIFGIVSHIQTGSIDPTRSPFPYQKTEAELMAEQPQIFEFLKTTFTVHIVGHQIHDKNYYLLPPTPCKIHSFVAEATAPIAAKFFSSSDFLHLLFAFANTIPSLDELLLSLTKYLVDTKIFTKQHIDQLSNTLSLHTGNDYRRLKLFFKRIEPLL